MNLNMIMILFEISIKVIPDRAYTYLTPHAYKIYTYIIHIYIIL